MEQTELLASVRAKAESWLTQGYDSETQAEVQALLNNTDPTDLIEAFYKDLEFGTGGLRGIMGIGSNRMNRYTVGAATQGLSNYLKREFADLPQIAVAIGHDCRNNSALFARIAAEVFSANGIKVYLFEALRPTPEVSFAIRELACQSGVMITASHNPKEYNGYKAYWSDGAQIIAPHDRNIIIEVNKIDGAKDINFKANEDLIQLIGEEIDKKFVDRVVELCQAKESIQRYKDMKIVYTPIHGAGITIIPRTLKAYGFENILSVAQQDVISGDFPTVYSPNPEEPAALELAIKRAEEEQADLVLASDPDADRIGVAVRNNEGKMTLINGNDICALLTYYAIASRKEAGVLQPNDFVVKTIVTSELLKSIADKEGVTLFDCFTGFKWIADVIRKQEGKMNYIGGGEESYGYLRESFIRDKSSVSACAMFCEMAAWALDKKGLTIYQLLQYIYLNYGLYKEQGVSVVRKGKSGAEEIEAMMKNYRENPLRSLAGSPVIEVLDYATLQGRLLEQNEVFTLNMPATSNVLQYKTADGTKVSIRPSGTEPKIKFYIGVRKSVKEASELELAEKACLDKIAQIRADLGI